MISPKNSSHPNRGVFWCFSVFFSLLYIFSFLFSLVYVYEYVWYRRYDIVRGSSASYGGVSFYIHKWYLIGMARRKIDWEAIKTEYVTSNIGQREIIRKYKIDNKMVAKHSKNDGWVQARKDYRARVQARAQAKMCNKEATKQASELDGLLNASYMLRDRIVKATQDPDQFNRYLVQYGSGKGEYDTEERIYTKVDTKAIKELTQSMRALESLIRSLNNIPTEAEAQRLQIEREKFELEKEKWEKEKAEATSAREVRVIFDTELEGWTE